MVEQKLYRFPPFPPPPEGIEIVPFGAFVPEGYGSATDESSGQPIEVDAWMGMPTVKILADVNGSEQKRRSQRKRRTAGNAKDATGRLIPWWEEWEEGESSRAMSQASFDSHMKLEERVSLAADDFRVGRTWPEIAHGVRLLWDQFRLYIGLISSIPIYKKVKSKSKGQVDGPDANALEVDEEEEEDVPRSNATKIVIAQDYLEPVPLPGKQLEPDPDRSTKEAHRLHAFVDDIENTIKVFLSSYMRDSGLIWYDKNLFIAPTILHFFLRFMLRNGVFADSEVHLNNLKRAVSVAALARKELPLTAKHGKRLPGQFDIACKECWGSKGNLTIQISGTSLPENTPVPSETCSFEAVLRDQDVEVVPSDVVLDSITARQVMEDNLDTDHNVPVTKIPADGDPWTAAVHAEEYTTESWTDTSTPWLMPLLGPSMFPLTMSTGVVEFSTRQIRDVIAPSKRSEVLHDTCKMSVVEEMLAEKYFKVMLSPWVQSESEETPDFPRPVIIATTNDDDGAWNPYRDHLTILVDEEVAGDLLTGMRFCGTWVQMVPEEQSKRHPKDCYWYMESLIASFPSYYTEGTMSEMLKGDEVDEDEDMS